jgi:hypothetical protein
MAKRSRPGCAVCSSWRACSSRARALAGRAGLFIERFERGYAKLVVAVV